MKRESNFELLRLVAMMMVLLLHCNFACLGGADYDVITKQPTISFIRILFEQACLVGVNIFVLISGWFGIKFRQKGALSIVYNVLFLGWLLAILLLPVVHSIPMSAMFRLSWFGSYYWFVPSYLILYICSPLLNAFAEQSNKKDYSLFLVCFFLLEFSLGWLWDWEHYGMGYSFLSFIGLYMVARYLHRFEDELTIMSMKRRSYIILYILCTIIPAIAAFVLIKRGLVFNMLSYASPFVISGAIAMILLFRKINIGTNSFVNWCAASAFSMYLLQLHPMIWPFWESNMNKVLAQYGWGWYLVTSIVVCVVFGILCILLDKLRILTWNKILLFKGHNNTRI